jgi:hypothetical protein
MGPFKNEHLFYAKWDGVSWNMTDLDPGAFIVNTISLALDSQNQPQIVYNDSKSYADVIVKDTRLVNGSWQTVPVDLISSLNGNLALDSAGKPYIIYNDYATGSLKIATLNH